MRDFRTGGARRPPPLKSILRLQQTVGNRAAQHFLGIGDGRRVDPVASVPGPADVSMRRKRRISAKALLIAAPLLVLQGAGLTARAVSQPRLMTALAAAISLFAAVLLWLFASKAKAATKTTDSL